MTAIKPVPRLLIALCGALTLTSSGICLAENVQMPNQPQQQAVGDQPWNVPIPARGATKAQVESRFGSPQSRHGPTGEPPIYYWDYAEFTVYFEADRVLHTVRKYRPQ